MQASEADPSDADPFDTGGLRGRVLDAWAASPARFREDANAEEDYALGGYRDRVIVELAQNAADAAARAGVARLALTLRDGTLTAANTGAPLDAAGVAALSSLRASSKRDDDSGPGPAGAAAVGRFGVGFAAAAAVSDEPRICSLTGAVAWSRDSAAELARRQPELAAELAARSGHVPVLRLPFPAAGTPPAGYATAVILPLRDAAAISLVGRLLAETGAALLLGLAALSRIEIEDEAGRRVLTAQRDGDVVTITSDQAGGRSVSRWRTTALAGEADPRLLADRPAEERRRPGWSACWAVPVGEDGVTPAGRLPEGVAGVVHAPTPTGEPLDLPALLLASFPLSPDRRQVAPGPLTAFLTEQAAAAYAAMLPGLAPGGGLLDLIPGPVGAGQLDAALRGAIRERLAETPFLPAAAAPGPRIRPRDALLLDASPPGLAQCLAPVLPGLIAGPSRHPGYAALGVRRLPLADLADALAGLDREPDWWRQLYAALDGLEPGQLAELGALPVPLADGRVVRGPRGLLLPGPVPAGGLAAGGLAAGGLAVLGLRVVHPGAAHPVLARLGAAAATPRSMLADPAVRAAVQASADAEDPEPIADAVLSLVAAAQLQPGEAPWLAELTLPGADGGWYAADELLIGGSPLAGVVAADGPFGTVDASLVQRHGAAALQAAGVLATFGVLVAEDVALDDPDLDLDRVEDWAAEVTAGLPGDMPPMAPELTAVRDLELVDPLRWPQALDLLREPPLRAALTEPTRLLLGTGRSADVPSYTAWWLRRAPILGGRQPGDLRTADADPLLYGLYDEAPVAVDPAVGRAIGLRSSLAALLAEPGGAAELLSRLADPARPVTRPQLRALWTALAGATGVIGTGAAETGAVDPPDLIRAVQDGEIVVADAADVLVLDAPDLLPLAAGRPLVLAPGGLAEQLADLLDVPLASEEISGRVAEPGRTRPVPESVRAILPGAPAAYQAHDRLLAGGVAVPWRYADGDLHAAGDAGLACGLAWAAGQWPERHLLTALLDDPAAAPRVLAEADLDD